MTRARQGAVRASFAARAHDLYETPPCAVHALLEAVELPRELWEPAAGRGAISRELQAAGHKVHCSDLVRYPGADRGIKSGVDFLKLRSRQARTIVTNPPFKLADDFIRHGLELGCDCFVLLRLMALEGARRSDIMEHLVRVWVGVQRLPMMHRDGWAGPKLSAGAMPFAWFEFAAKRRLKRSAITLQRINWR
jgi:hypothetical protein